MNEPKTPSARRTQKEAMRKNEEFLNSIEWDSMTDQQKIEWLAVFMGYTKKVCHDHADGKQCLWMKGDASYLAQYECPFQIPLTETGKEVEVLPDGWNPLTDWNHTMEVVEKMTEEWSFILKQHGKPHGWTAMFGSFDSNIYVPDAQGAICRAAFLALSA